MRAAVAKQKQPHPHRETESESLHPTPDSHSLISNLHRTAGNRAIGQYLQAKLAVGIPGDQYEQEADRVAEQVTQTPQRTLISGEQEAPSPSLVQRRVSGSSAGISQAPPSVHAALSSPGQPLPPALQEDMEQRFGHDFSNVRLHSGSVAEQSAEELNAKAYTVGRDIVLGAGQPSLETGEGRRLMAHELTHVAQQSRLERGAEGATGKISTAHADGLIQRSERDPDELAAMANEDESIKQRAKRAIASNKPDLAVHEVMWRLIHNYGLDEHFELNGSRYDKKQKGVLVELTGKGPRTTGTIVGGDEVLQRVARGDAAKVAKELEAQIGKVDTARGTVDYVFIMGADARKSGNKFYAEAKKFFKAQYPGAIMVENVRELEGINQTINSGNKPVANLHIVSHAHPDGTLQFSLDPSDKTPGQVQYSELKKANEKGSVTQPKPDLVGFWTNVMIHGCNLGRNEEMLKETQKAFGGKARVIAPTHEQVYSGGKESLGGPFYEEPGISKLSDDKAFERIKAKPEYAFITDWKGMRKKLRRFNQSIPEIVYEGKFPIKGKELDLLKSERGAKEAAHYTLGGSRVEGEKTVFTFKPDDPFKRGEIEIRQEMPPNDKTAIDQARETVPRPNAFAYKVRRIRSGLTLSVVVDIQRTEWEIYHTEMKKQGKGFSPTPGTKPWFGDTDR